MNIDEYRGVYVFVESINNKVTDISLELLGCARTLADSLDDKVTAIILGSDINNKCSDLISYGADKVICCNDKNFEIYLSEPFTQAVTQILAKSKPNILLMGATSIGRDLAPRVAARLKTGLTADCTQLEISEYDEFLMTRPAFGGSLMATITCPEHRPQISTVRCGVMKALEKDSSRKGTIEIFDVVFDTSKFKVKFIKEVLYETQNVNIEKAGILISGGRGVGSAKNFKHLEDLGHMLNGIVSASRSVVDTGVMPPSTQVGQTGKTVRPKLYFALGISGATQHTSGMEESEYIIAINSDKDAHIFNICDLGIIGDVNKIIPLLNKELNKIL